MIPKGSSKRCRPGVPVRRTLSHLDRSCYSHDLQDHERPFLNLSSQVYLILVLLLGFSVDLHAAKLFDSAAKKKLTGYLDEICQWIMTTELTGDTLKILPEGQDSLAVRGNFARVLVAGFELTKNNSRYLDEALRWG